MTEILELIIKIASVIGAVGVIGGVIFGVYRWIMKQNRQGIDIRQLKEENTLICYALSACLDGLEQLGANHTVPKAKAELEKYLNKAAHK